MHCVGVSGLARLILLRRRIPFPLGELQFKSRGYWPAFVIGRSNHYFCGVALIVNILACRGVGDDVSASADEARLALDRAARFIGNLGLEPIAVVRRVLLVGGRDFEL